MKILVTGVNGQLGHDVILRLTDLDIACQGVDIGDFDLTDETAVTAWIRAYEPTAVIHCAAYTAVDRSEDEPELCRAVNVTGTANIARVCRDIGAKMMYISTDYVFGGAGERPFESGDPKDPKGQYGLTKLQGEEQVLQYLKEYFIVRTAWVFGKNGKNFVKTMLRLGQERSELTVVNDQFGSPTYTRDLAVLLCEMIATDRYGVYHATNEGFCSWYDFATAIMTEAGLPAIVRPVTSDQYPTRAVRPKNSRLSKQSLDLTGFQRLPPWRDALRRYLLELKD